jgi:glutamate-1-semialdehyde 2,1-aminomutase
MSSQELYERALATAPGGVHSPVRAFRSVGGTPVFFSSAAGAHLTDVGGQRYIDFCMSFGPLILGHRHPAVAGAVHDAVERGWSFGACEPYSLALAEWILARVPWVERLRFVSSGTEAVMSALRVARAATNRPRVLKFDGCYHGHADQMLVKAGSGLAGRTAASSAGIPAPTAAQTLVAPLDDETALDQILDTHGAEIAAVILEAVPANYGLLPQRQAWLDGLRRRCRASDHGIPLGLEGRVRDIRPRTGSGVLRQGDRRRLSRRVLRRQSQSAGPGRARRTRVSGRDVEREPRGHDRGPCDAGGDDRARRLDDARAAHK